MPELRVMTYNILAGAEKAEGDKARLELICQVVRQAQPDLLALQEVTSEEAFHSLAHTLEFNETALAHGVVQYHIGLLSRYPIIGWKEHNNPEIFRHGALEVQLETPSGELTCFAVHLYPGHAFKDEDQRLVEVKYLLEKMQPYRESQLLLMGDFNTMSPQDELKVEDWPKQWHRRLRKQGNQLRRDAISQVLEAGYFDCYRLLHPASPPFVEEEEATQNPLPAGETERANQLEGEVGSQQKPSIEKVVTGENTDKPAGAYNEQAGYTLPADKPNIRLDYIFASPAIAAHLRSCEVLRTEPAFLASDHLPLLASFDLQSA